MQQYDSFSQIEAFGDALPGTVINNAPGNNQPQVIKPVSATPTNVVQGATVSNKASDQVTLETDDGFFNIKAMGEPNAVSKVFEKLQSSMGAQPAKSQGTTTTGTVVKPTPTDATTAAAASAANAAKDAAVEAKLKAKEDELEKKKKAEEEKLATDKKKAQQEADDKAKKAKEEAEKTKEEEKKKTEEAAK